MGALRIKILKICVWLFLVAVCPAFSASNSFAPPSGKTLLLVGQDRNTIVLYVGATGNTPGGTMFYASIQEVKGLNGPNEYGSGPQDGEALLQYYPNSVIQVGLYMVGGLDRTIAGKYNAHLRTLAKWIKKANRPVYLRLGYEFDNPSNHYDPGQYKEAFRYVVNFLRKEGVRNAAYVWHSYCGIEKSGWQWMDWYPGDDYVDWFGVSMFTTQQIPMASDFLGLAREHRKPFMIAESTPWGVYTIRGKMDWFNHIFRFINQQNIEAFCYIDSDWDIMPMFQGQHIGDARVEANADIQNLWLNEINQPRYLKASPDLFRLLGWTKSKT